MGVFASLVALLLLTLLAIACSKSGDSPPQSEPSSQKSSSEYITEADPLYVARTDLNNARRAVILLRQARVHDAGNYELAWKLAKYEYFLGSHSKDETERENSFREGIAAGKAAVALQDDKPDGHFWLGANYGGEAQSSLLASLSSVQDIRSQMEKVIALNEGYESGSAYLGLGELYLKAPKVLGGDTKKAIEYLEKGLRFGSDNALLHLRLAEAYHVAGRDADAKKQIDYILQMKPNDAYRVEYDDAVTGAKALQKKIESN